MTTSDLLMDGWYDYRLVALSVLISILGAYAGLDLAERMVAARARAHLAWLLGGAAASGIGTWSMHYTAMLAFSLPVPVLYDWPTASVSYLPAFVGTTVALILLRPSKTAPLRAAAARVSNAGGITALHYTAMASMRLPAMCRYSPVFLALSMVLPALCSFGLPLHLTLVRRNQVARRRWKKVGTVLLLGSANPVMHYTGMAGTTFVRSTTPPDLSHAVSISLIGLEAITIVPVMVIAVALVTSLVDRLRKQGTLLDELFEHAPQAVALTTVDDRVIRVNTEFTRLFGYAPDETIGRRLSELIVPDDESPNPVRRVAGLAHAERVEAEGVCRRKDGSRLRVAMVRVPVSIPGAEPVVYAIYRDITEHERAAEELHRSLDQLRALAARVQTVREDERTRVAREIHDVLGQALTAIKIDISSLLRESPSDKGPGAARIGSVLQLLDDTIRVVRRIATELRPGILDDLGLAAAVEWAAEEFQGRTGTRVHVSVPDAEIAIDPARATAVFRIFQETLTNVARHANATRVDVQLATEGSSLTLEVHDNGLGFSEMRLSAGTSLGTIGMRERALLLGGELIIRSAPGRGTTVTVRIPEGRKSSG